MRSTTQGHRGAEVPTSRSAGDDEPPPRLLKRWGITDPAPPRPIAPNRWRVDAETGSFLLKELKRHEAADRRRVLFEHNVTAALDAAGLPVLAPVPAARGTRTLVTAGGRVFALYPWVTGRRRGGLELTFGQCERLGALLGELHAAMDRLTAPVQQSLLVPTPRACDAVSAVDRMLTALPADVNGNDFAALTERRLLERRALLTEMADHQPPETDVSTVGHLHGAFHEDNLRHGGSGNVTAVLGWESMTTGPIAGEVVRAAARLFASGDERGFDLDRVVSFVRGHRSAFPLDAGQIQAAVHREWWERLCDPSPGAAALVGWWSAHLELTLDVFAAPYTDVPAETPGGSPAYG
jgi:Ser/Thr protein kinase RdoA (MazF antagonist)